MLPCTDMLTSGCVKSLFSKRTHLLEAGSDVQTLRGCDYSARCLAFVCFLYVEIAAPQSPSAANGATTSEQRKTSEPYTGDLSVFDSPGREDRLQINRVMDLLGIAPGKNVADIGAGSGWFTVRAARRVGAGGLVYAVDINPEAIRYVGERAQKEKLAECEDDSGQGRRSAVCLRIQWMRCCC